MKNWCPNINLGLNGELGESCFTPAHEGKPHFLYRGGGELNSLNSLLATKMGELALLSHLLTVLSNKMADNGYKLRQKVGKDFNCNGQFAKNGVKKGAPKSKGIAKAKFIRGSFIEAKRVYSKKERFLVS